MQLIPYFIPSRGHSVTTVRFRAEHDFEYPSAAELGPNHTDIELALWNADGRISVYSFTWSNSTQSPKNGGKAIQS